MKVLNSKNEFIVYHPVAAHDVCDVHIRYSTEGTPSQSTVRSKVFDLHHSGHTGHL